MWINCNISLPLEAGKYETLIEIDEWGALRRSNGEVFDGEDWSHSESNRQFIRYWWGSADQYKQITTRLESERNRELEDQEIINYLKSTGHSSPIIKIYNEYIILAQDHRDLAAKKSAINKGRILGFYQRDRILQAIQTKPVQIDWSGFPQSTQDTLKQQRRERFIAKWFDSDQYPISSKDDKFTKVTVLIPDPHIQDKIATQQFLDEMKEVGFQCAIVYGFRKELNVEGPHLPLVKERNYNDSITFKLI